MNRKWWVLVAVGTGTFMSALDGSVVNAILPVLKLALGADVATVEWVITVYLLIVSGLLLGFGRLGDLRGHKGVYLTGMIGFVVASAMCGLAPSSGWLIGARGVQAIAAAMLFANSPAILTRTFPGEQRGQALGIQAMMTYLGLTAGPSLGGVLAQYVSWRAVFFINVPVGALAFFLSAKFIEREKEREHPPAFDHAGAVLFFAGLLALLLALNQGHAWGWASAPVVALAAAAAVLLAAFVWRESHAAHPMLDLRLFKTRAFSGAAVSAVLNYICLFSVLFLVPFYLIQARGFGAAHAGLLLTAQPLLMMLSAPIAGTLSDRIGVRIPAVIGMTILAVGLFLLARMGPHSALSHIELALGVCGLGTGTFIAPNNSGLMGAAPRDKQGIAAGVLATARNVGMVLGIGLAGAILTTVLHGGGSYIRAVDLGILVACGVAAAGAVTSALR